VYPPPPPVLVGSFSGTSADPRWNTSAPTYTCVAACDELFPGNSAMQGSTKRDGTVTGTCWGDLDWVGPHTFDCLKGADTDEVGPIFNSPAGTYLVGLRTFAFAPIG
jgi:hypothetical protein